MFDGIARIAKSIFGDANTREIRRLQPWVTKINALEPEFERLDHGQILAKTAEFKERIERGQKLDELLPEAFAITREGAKRTLGIRHYDCQLIGGIVLHNGKISEMKTGEGKTLVATTAVYLNALEQKGVHVVTVNDYLAARDAEWMGQLYRYLGLSVGTILSNERSDLVKRKAYAADITYGTNNEFGFDYLRDNMKYSLDQYVQRGHHFGIVDEVDSILIDEARTPLIISGPAEAGVELYAVVDGIIPLLQNEVDFVIDEKQKSVTLTDEGVNKIEARLGIDNLYDPQSMEALHHVMQSLKAHHTFKKDKDYVVRDGKVVIVDEFTGRLMTGRRWSDGLHQAVEAKEKVQIEAESQVYATITFQNLFRMYKKLAGMTGTAETEAAEFASIYNLETVVIPTNRSVARRDDDDIVYKTQMEKFRAVVKEIKACNERGQPVLVGTTSVEKSEILARLLQRDGVPHEVLNAKNHVREAQIVAQAGRRGAVTISTNMAGRGTDIKLGGNAEEMAKLEADPVADPIGYAAALEKHKAEVENEQAEVKKVGGLHIIGTERHESRRVDNQLRGRSGRQGDPGSSRFYLSLEDDLLRLFGSDKITVWMERMGLKDDEPIEHRWITSSIEGAQKKVEGHHFQMRKNLLEYDDVMNYQRKAVYDLRRRALAGDGIRQMVDEAVENVVHDLMDDCVPEGIHPEQWRASDLRARISRVFGIDWQDTDAQIRDHSRTELFDRIHSEAKARLEEKVASLGSDSFLQVTRMLLLQYTDQLWKDHLLAIDRLRQGVGLRGYGQRNPLLEYKKEAFHMFMYMGAIRDESILENVFRVQPEVAELAVGASNPKRAAQRLIQEDGFKPLPKILPAEAPAAAAALPDLNDDDLYDAPDPVSSLDDDELYDAPEPSAADGDEDDGLYDAPEPASAVDLDDDYERPDPVTDGEDEYDRPDPVTDDIGETADAEAPAADDEPVEPVAIGVSEVSELGEMDTAAPGYTPDFTRAPAKGEEARQFAAAVGISRNDPCPCGSGMKFKRCCGAEDDAQPGA
jgi:preprotein translocase subunit SecA